MIIYKTTNLVNGKIYIGQKPIMNTEKELLNSTYFGSGRKIKTAVNEFGPENFKREVIDNSDNLVTLNEIEEYWIDKYDATNTNIGYNIAKKTGPCYFTGCKHTKYSKEQMSIKKLGIKKTKEHSQKVGEKHNKKVYQHSLDNSFFNKEYKSITSASIINNICPTTISACCKNNRNTSGNYTWSFNILTFDEYKERIHNIKTMYNNPKKVIKLDKNFNIINEYVSINAAAKDNNIKHQHISDCCSGRYKTAGGFIWRYKN